MEFVFGIIGVVIGGALGFFAASSSYKNKESLRQQEIQKAQDEIKGKTQQLQKIERQKTEVEKGSKETQDHLKKAQNEAKKLKGDLEKQTQEKNKLQQELEIEQKKRAEEKQAGEQREAELQKQIEEKQTSCDALEQEKGDLRIKLAEAEDVADKRMQEIEDLKQTQEKELAEKDKERQEQLAEKDKELQEKAAEFEEKLTEKDEKFKKQEEQSKLNEDKFRKNITVRARALHELRRTMAVLESLEIPEEFEYKTAENESEEDMGGEDMTVQLAEYEKQVIEKEGIIKELQEKLQSHDTEIQNIKDKFDLDDETLAQLNTDLSNKDKRLEEMAMERADLILELEKHKERLGIREQQIENKEDMIQKYLSQIEEYEKNSQATNSEDVEQNLDIRKVIESDPNLDRGQQEAMMMLYDQYNPQEETSDGSEEDSSEQQ